MSILTSYDAQQQIAIARHYSQGLVAVGIDPRDFNSAQIFELESFLANDPEIWRAVADRSPEDQFKEPFGNQHKNFIAVLQELDEQERAKLFDRIRKAHPQYAEMFA